MAIEIKLTSVLVDDQAKALEFYTTKLGFVKSKDVPLGEARWLTVVSADEPDGPELLLEPMGFAPARDYQKALFDAGIPLTAFAVDNVQQEYARLTELGVKFRGEPMELPTVTIAILEDTCGNLIQIFHLPPEA